MHRPDNDGEEGAAPMRRWTTRTFTRSSSSRKSIASEVIEFLAILYGDYTIAQIGSDSLARWTQREILSILMGNKAGVKVRKSANSIWAIV